MNDITIASTIDVEGTKRLGVDTGLDPLTYARTGRAGSGGFSTEAGLLIGTDGAATPWPVMGTVERGGHILVYGQDFSGRSLTALLAEAAAARTAKSTAAARIFAALRVLLAKASQVSLPPLIPGGIIVAETGALLLLPERLVLRALDAKGHAARSGGDVQWRHPDLVEQDGTAFTIAALAYALFTGKPAFSSEVEDDARIDIRDGYAVPASLAAPALRRDAADLIDKALGLQREEEGVPRLSRKQPAVRPSIAELSAMFGPAAGGIDSFLSSVSEEEKLETEAALKRFVESRGAKIKTKRFLRRNRRTLTVAAAAVIGLGLFVQSYVSGILNRPNTVGLSPREVVETYYRGLDQLDHQLMEACVTGKAGKGDIESVVNLFVISRMRLAYENKDVVIPAAKWLAAGSPKTDGMVFGTAELAVESLQSPEPSADQGGEARYRVAYLFARPGDEAEPVVVERREDLLTLVRGKKEWRISSIDRTELPR